MTFLRCAAIALASVLLGAAAQAQTISIGTSSVGSLNNSLGNALGKVMTEQGGLRVRVVPFGGGQQFLPSIEKKELEMAIPSSNDALFAYQGTGPFAGNPSPNLRVIGTVFPYYIGWFVRKDSPYKSMVDLKGKRIAVGFTANSAQRTSVLASLAADGLKESDFDGVQVPHVVRGADDFMQGRVEATSFAVGAGKVAEADSKVGGVRYLSLRNTPEALKGLQSIMPRAYIGQLQPGPGLVGIVEPTYILFEDYLVLTGTQLSDEAAYKTAQVLHEHQDKLAAVARPFNRYKPADLVRSHGIPFHPGAIKYYREKGLWKDT
jgi:TRAP transporter TAXI family solute receptor